MLYFLSDKHLSVFIHDTTLCIKLIHFNCKFINDIMFMIKYQCYVYMSTQTYGLTIKVRGFKIHA